MHQNMIVNVKIEKKKQYNYQIWSVLGDETRRRLNFGKNSGKKNYTFQKHKENNPTNGRQKQIITEKTGTD